MRVCSAHYTLLACNSCPTLFIVTLDLCRAVSGTAQELTCGGIFQPLEADSKFEVGWREQGVGMRWESGGICVIIQAGVQFNCYHNKLLTHLETNTNWISLALLIQCLACRSVWLC